MMPQSISTLSAPPPPDVARFALTGGDLALLTGFLNARGGQIRPVDLDQIHARFPALDPTRARFYASLSNGKDIFVNKSRHVGVSSTAWDVCHLLGHMTQWNLHASLGRTLGLRYYGEAARAMAVADFRGGSLDDLRQVIAYEVEANRIAFSILGAVLGAPRQRHLRVDFYGYVQHDLDFLLNYYANDGHGPDEGGELPFELARALRDAVPSVIDPLLLPSARDCPFRAFDILSVPVLHLDQAS